MQICGKRYLTAPCFLGSKCPLFELREQFLIYDVSLSFEIIYLHTGPEDLLEDDKQKILVEAIFAHTPSLAELEHVLSFIMHGIALSNVSITLKAHIALLSRLFETTKAFNEAHFEALKEIVFVQPNKFKDVLFSTLPDDVLGGKFENSEPFIDLTIVIQQQRSF